MQLRHVVAVTLVGGIVALLLGASVAHVTAQPTRFTLDADHALASEQKQAEFVRTGSATADIGAPDMSITVASDHEASGCELSGFHSDLRNDYLCIQYNEEIDRELRVYIPAEYWTPYLRKGVEPVAGDVQATFEPVQDGTYTSVKVSVTESGMYAYPINAEASWFAGIKSGSIERLENVSGVGVPNSTAWSYIEPSQLGGENSAYVIQAPNGTDQLVMEYETSNGEWSSVPDERKAYAPVYYTTKQGVDNRVYVFATTENASEVRYKTKTGAKDQIAAAIREIAQAPARLEEILGIDIPFIGN